MKLGIIEHIDSAHSLPGHVKCGVLHGHTYRVELIIEGEPEKGMVLDFGEMKTLLKDVLKKYDHRLFNDFIEYPSVENICLLLRKDLEAKIKHRFVLRVWEGEGKWAES
jgi:6-pyruvoyltetrahydropterin/6-carboxytetrahydropterin synthase